MVDCLVACIGPMFLIWHSGPVYPIKCTLTTGRDGELGQLSTARGWILACIRIGGGIRGRGRGLVHHSSRGRSTSTVERQAPLNHARPGR